ncbi:hypothetical protein D3C81_1652010 [compost metagenome]
MLNWLAISSSAGQSSGRWLRSRCLTWALRLASLRYLTSRLAGDSLRKVARLSWDWATLSFKKLASKRTRVTGAPNSMCSQKRIR